MKVALIAYHKNILNLYPQEWIDKYRDSVENQTHKNFDVFELNYGDMGERIFEQSQYITRQCPTFVHGMNYLIDLVLGKGYDYIFNSNVDDYFSYDRIEKQLFWLEQGYDVVSSNFVLIDGDREKIRHEFHGLDIEKELNRSHNIIAHPAVAYNRRFFEKCRYEPDEIPYEDLWLWRRALKEGMNFKIVPEVLLYHRLHDKMVSNKSNDRKQIV